MDVTKLQKIHHTFIDQWEIAERLHPEHERTVCWCESEATADEVIAAMQQWRQEAPRCFGGRGAGRLSQGGG